MIFGIWHRELSRIDINRGTFTRPDGSTYRQIEVSDSPDWDLFNRMASVLKLRLKGKCTIKLDGLDQRYWDLETRSGKITLHRKHNFGITIYPSEGAHAGRHSITLLKDAYYALADFNPD